MVSVCLLIVRAPCGSDGLKKLLELICEKKKEEKEKSFENREIINQKQEAGNIRRKQEFSSQNGRVGISESN